MNVRFRLGKYNIQKREIVNFPSVESALQTVGGRNEYSVKRNVQNIKNFMSITLKMFVFH